MQPIAKGGKPLGGPAVSAGTGVRLEGRTVGATEGTSCEGTTEGKYIVKEGLGNALG
jgi:hypothetical protein